MPLNDLGDQLWSSLSFCGSFLFLADSIRYFYHFPFIEIDCHHFQFSYSSRIFPFTFALEQRASVHNYSVILCARYFLYRLSMFSTSFSFRSVVVRLYSLHLPSTVSASYFLTCPHFKSI